MLVHGPDKYKSQKMCGKAVDDCLVALKLIPDQFVASKIIDDNIYSIQNKVCGNAVFLVMNRVFLIQIIIIFKLMILIIMQMMLKLLFISDFWLGKLNLKNVKHLKKEFNENLMLIMLHPRIFACQKMRKKEIEPVFTE